MATGRECVCCCEIDIVKDKMKESSNEIHCITDHEGFQSVCLNVWVLQTVYFSYRSRYGDTGEKSVHE